MKIISKGNLRVFALGGLHEVGKNCYVFETERDIIIVDCGVKFVNCYGLADGSIPDFNYLIERKNKIKGLLITHAHDDHISAVPYLLQQLPNIPLYGSEFTVSLAKQKLSEVSQKWNIFHDNSVINLGDFRVSFFRVTHSIPGSFGFFIECLRYSLNIVTTGDFKFDWTGIGEKFDLTRLMEYSKKGVDLLLSESTNSEHEGTTPSETKVIARLESIISTATGRVIVTSFSSNVYRLRKVMEIAKKTSRFIVLLGTSLLKAMKAIHNASLWELDSSLFLKASDIVKTSNKNLIIFCTGSQGEERSVLTRLANNTYPGWKIERGDSIIWTSSPIMDNKTNVDLVSNRLYASGAIVYNNSETDLLHSSGHAYQEDLKLLLSLLNPRFFLPIHGDLYMLKKHQNLAESVGIPRNNIFVCQNGEVIASDDNKNFSLNGEMVFASPQYILEGKVLPIGDFDNNLNIRQIIAKQGLVIITIFSQKDILDLPSIFTYGFINMQKNKNLIEIWKRKINRYLIEQNMFKGITTKEINKQIINYINNSLLSDWAEKPLIRIINKLNISICD